MESLKVLGKILVLAGSLLMAACGFQSPGKSSNADLRTLNLNQGHLMPTFDSMTQSYTLEITNPMDEVHLQGIPADPRALVTGLETWKPGQTSGTPLQIKVIAPAGNVKVYTFHLKFARALTQR